MKTYLVGGAVRDELLGLTAHEHDYVVVGATPDQMQQQGFRPVGKHFPVFLHPETNEEYALARTERKSGIGHQGFEFFTDTSVTLEDDLVRRDLTINAIAKNEQGDILDPLNGQADLDNRILRHVSEAFSEDPLRVYRVARFKAQLSNFDFNVAPETMTLMTKLSDSGELQHLSDERVWQETFKALKSPNPVLYFETLIECHANSRSFKQTEYHDLQRLKAAASKTDDPLIRFAALFSQKTCELKSVPNEFADLANIVQRMAPALVAIHSAEELCQALDSLDVQRREERAQLALLTTEIITQINQQFVDFELIEKGIKVLGDINYGDIAKSNEGSNIKAAITDAKIDALRTLFTHRD